MPFPTSSVLVKTGSQIPVMSKNPSGSPHPVSCPISQPSAVGATLASNWVYSLDWPVPADVTTVRVKIRNVKTLDGTAGAAMTGTAVAIGGTPNGGGAGWFGAPTVFTSQTVPAFPSSLILDNVSVTPNPTSKRVRVAVYLPSGAAYAGWEDRQPTCGWIFPASGASDLNTLSGLTFSSTNGSACQISLEYSTEAYRLVSITDSMHRGTETGLLYTPECLAHDAGWSASPAGCAVIQAVTWADPAYWWLWDWLELKDACVLIALGSNDVQVASASANAILTALGKIADRVRAYQPHRIGFATISPRSDASSPQNVVRNAVNDVLRTLPFGATFLHDQDLVLRDPNSTNAMLSGYGVTGSGVTVHATQSGMAAQYATY